MRIVILLAFVGIIGALSMAGYFMMRRGRSGKGRNDSMMRALAVRVALSIALFAFILLSWRLGWIQPTGVPIGR
jgi:Protein of unknown function (DUF2909)